MLCDGTMPLSIIPSDESLESYGMFQREKARERVVVASTLHSTMTLHRMVLCQSHCTAPWLLVCKYCCLTFVKQRLRYCTTAHALAASHWCCIVAWHVLYTGAVPLHDMYCTLVLYHKMACTGCSQAGWCCSCCHLYCFSCSYVPTCTLTSCFSLVWFTHQEACNKWWCCVSCLLRLDD